MLLTPETAESIVEMVLAGIHREYPNKIAHVLTSDADAKPPRILTPAFYGCFDWHSAVHGHWTLVRLLRRYPEASWARRALAALETSITEENIAGEVRYVSGSAQRGFEWPYGLAWLLMLAAELAGQEAGDGSLHGPRLAAMTRVLEPLEEVVASRFLERLPRLTHPIRSGEHSQTAFAMGLALDWARIRKRASAAAILEECARDFHLTDRDAPLTYEPSGHDFMSPALGTADLMRRVLGETFASWLSDFLPALETASDDSWLPVVAAADQKDGKLVHLDGLCLSRAWMLQGIASALPTGDPRRGPLAAAEAAHARMGLPRAFTSHYAGSHWLGTYAAYYLTGRGLASA